MTEPKQYTVETVDGAWSYINGPYGFRDGPYRYRWEAEECAAELDRAYDEDTKR